jgi:hypothetical protein
MVGNGRAEERGKLSGMGNGRVLPARLVFIGDREPAGRCRVEKRAISSQGAEPGASPPRCPPQCLPSAASRALAWSETHRQGCMGSRSQERKSWGWRWATFWGQERASTVADWLAAWWRQRSWTPRTADARSPVSGELSEARSRKPKLDGRFWLGHLGGPDWEPGRGRSAECGERVPSRRLHGRFENVRGKYQGELEG